MTLQFCGLLASSAGRVESISWFLLQGSPTRKLHIFKKNVLQRKTLYVAHPSMAKSPGWKSRWTDGEFVVLLLNCIQLTSQEFDCVYEIIWCQKRCSRWALLATVVSTKQHYQKILLTRLSASPRRVRNDRFGDISSGQMFRKKKAPRTTQLAKDK